MTTGSKAIGFSGVRITSCCRDADGWKHRKRLGSSRVVEPQAAPQGHRRRTGGDHQAAAPAAKPAWNQTFQAAAVINYSRCGANKMNDVGF